MFLLLLLLFCFVVHEGDGEVFGRAERRLAIWELEPPMLSHARMVANLVGAVHPLIQHNQRG